MLVSLAPVIFGIFGHFFRWASFCRILVRTLSITLHPQATCCNLFLCEPSYLARKAFLRFLSIPCLSDPKKFPPVLARTLSNRTKATCHYYLHHHHIYTMVIFRAVFAAKSPYFRAVFAAKVA